MSNLVVGWWLTDKDLLNAEVRRLRAENQRMLTVVRDVAAGRRPFQALRDVGPPA